MNDKPEQPSTQKYIQIKSNGNQTIESLIPFMILLMPNRENMVLFAPK